MAALSQVVDPQTSADAPSADGDLSRAAAAATNVDSQATGMPPSPPALSFAEGAMDAQHSLGNLVATIQALDDRPSSTDLGCLIKPLMALHETVRFFGSVLQ